MIDSYSWLDSYLLALPLPSSRFLIILLLLGLLSFLSLLSHSLTYLAPFFISYSLLRFLFCYHFWLKFLFLFSFLLFFHAFSSPLSLFVYKHISFCKFWIHFFLILYMDCMMNWLSLPGLQLHTPFLDKSSQWFDDELDKQEVEYTNSHFSSRYSSVHTPDNH